VEDGYSNRTRSKKKIKIRKALNKTKMLSNQKFSDEIGESLGLYKVDLTMSKTIKSSSKKEDAKSARLSFQKGIE